ncbi:methyltransferase [Leifsonia xyli subsp. cynodontis DSM 46306]|uniref:Uncharacterized protein n=1 Tax=Leifsonia xyli subsp. cynodontis DSM 46306 TaxID=1389489 RepID=U3PB89_LEIXC|nr:methyltransferase [Leifsonia xyli subsp. cynodontis DSM 46306]
MTTCLPAASASRASTTCRPLGAQMTTMSMSAATSAAPRASNSAGRAAPSATSWSARAAAAAGAASTSAVRARPGCRRIARAWLRPMMPQPTMAALRGRR